ncbi:hypothetical protein V8B97DRAFT_1965301 [Scleroderma yunnanense]
MKSLTNCQANRTRVGVKTVRTHPAGHGMKSLTSCQANRTRVGENTPSWTWHEITHILIAWHPF